MELLRDTEGAQTRPCFEKNGTTGIKRNSPTKNNNNKYKNLDENYLLSTKRIRKL